MKILTIATVLVLGLLVAPSETLAQVAQEEIEPPRSMVELPATLASAADWHQGLHPEISSLAARKRSEWLIPGIGAAAGAGYFLYLTIRGLSGPGGDGAVSPLIFPYAVVVGGSLGGGAGLLIEAVIQRLERRSPQRYE